MVKYRMKCKACLTVKEYEAEEQGMAEFLFGQEHGGECDSFLGRCKELVEEMNARLRDEMMVIEEIQ